MYRHTRAFHRLIRVNSEYEQSFKSPGLLPPGHPLSQPGFHPPGFRSSRLPASRLPPSGLPLFPPAGLPASTLRASTFPASTLPASTFPASALPLPPSTFPASTLLAFCPSQLLEKLFVAFIVNLHLNNGLSSVDYALFYVHLNVFICVYMYVMYIWHACMICMHDMHIIMICLCV